MDVDVGQEDSGPAELQGMSEPEELEDDSPYAAVGHSPSSAALNELQGEMATTRREMADMLDAMQKIKLSEEEIDSVLRIVAAVRISGCHGGASRGI